MTSSADVAVRAGVSRSTVSQILNGRGHLFTEETVARVKETAQAMGYRPSLAGRTLVRGKSDIVITLIPDITFGPTVREFVDLLTAGLAKEGLTNLLRLSSSEDSLQDAVLGLRPHSIVTMAQLQPEDIKRLQDQGVHVVGQSQAFQEAADTAIGRLQAEHLRSQGYTRIAAVRPRSKREQYSAPQREKGVLEHGSLHGLEVLPTLEVGLTSDEALKAVRRLPTGRVGLACYNDEVALAMLSAALREGVRVPTDLGIIGVDDSVIARASTPTISSVSIDLELNVRELINHIVSGQELPSRPAVADEFMSGFRVVVRETTGSS
jgi:DNA-binding LacI/PurR family transcriptional regulator